MPKEFPTIYLTKEQLHRLSGLACDALVGLQLHTNESADTYVYGEFVPIDDPSGRDLECFEVDPDGTYRRTT